MNTENRTGMMIAVVGPSGAGKDSLINRARAHFRDNPGIGFVRRMITRSADGQSEDHESVNQAQFSAMESAGMFAVWWHAHGLYYGIPASTVPDLESGKTLIANGSRNAVNAFRDVYSSFAVIQVTARAEVIASRLRARGRESAQDIERRLARQADDWMPNCRLITIDNSGSLEDASAAFIRAIEELARVSETSLT